jgi:hypothetical protein
MIIFNANDLYGQNKLALKNQSKSINYSKYIGKTVKYFFSDFSVPIKDTIPIRDYMGINSFILDLGNNVSLYIFPQLVKDSALAKRKIEDSFDLNFFNHYKIKAILYKKNGKTIKVYGKHNGQYREDK